MPKFLSKATRSLPHRLTETERAAAGLELAKLIQDIESEEERQGDIKEQLKAKLTELSARRKQLVITVSRGERMDEVEVVCEIADNGDMVTERRTDNGEVVNVRPPRPGETQAALDLFEEEEAKAQERAAAALVEAAGDKGGGGDKGDKGDAATDPLPAEEKPHRGRPRKENT